MMYNRTSEQRCLGLVRTRTSACMAKRHRLATVCGSPVTVCGSPATEQLCCYLLNDVDLIPRATVFQIPTESLADWGLVHWDA